MENQNSENTSASEQSEEQKEKNYDRAITLIQNQVQLFWLVFGAFLLTETVLLAGIATIVKEGVNNWVFWGAILGFVLCFPWWASFQYNHAFYKLRIEEALDLENESNERRFFRNGADLIDGKKPHGVSVPWHTFGLRPKYAIYFLIGTFALIFIVIAVSHNPCV